MIVDWSDFALDDLEDIKHYISKDSPFYARELIELIFTTAERLIDFPLSGREVPEAEDQTIREVIVQSYRVMYRVEPSRVLMLAVMHGSRDLTNPKNQAWDKTIL
jgi:addiction module RelE/StbE family toxin